MDANGVVAITSIIGTFALVIVTGWYVRLTHNLVQSNRQIVAMQSRLLLTCDIRSTSPERHELIVRNEGPGTAYDIACSVQVDGNPEYPIPPFALAPNSERGIPSLLIDPVTVHRSGGALGVILQWRNLLDQFEQSLWTFRWDSPRGVFVLESRGKSDVPVAGQTKAAPLHWWQHRLP